MTIIIQKPVPRAASRTGAGIGSACGSRRSSMRPATASTKLHTTVSRKPAVIANDSRISSTARRCTSTR